jgi:cell fate regulator YaaT (PSP1 superfamily)
LPMKLLACEYSFDGEKLLFYFTAPERVDFRALVRELASIFKVRIELRQIGPRDEAKITGGIAPCGKTELCCTQFMKSFFPVTTRMAKIQRLPVHQEKLLGLCGQLKCCLKFELDTYEILSASLPKEGTRVSTKQGKGTILSVDVLRQWVLIRLEDDRQIRCMSDEVSVLREG